MVDYRLLGFESENQYLGYFFETLLKTNWTYEYFVYWEKVRENTRKNVKEISLLNSLTKIPPKNRKEELQRIFMEYPKTIPVIPSIIAIREKIIPILEIEKTPLYKTFDFSVRRLEEQEIQDLTDFCEKAGILQLLGEINDLYAYMLGVEVGLDSNARKNRSGDIFQQLVGMLLKRKLKQADLKIVTEDSSVVTTRSKRADFVLYHRGSAKIVIECNFYNTTGSKPIETANAYVDFQRRIREKGGTSFIWITDGPAWETMKQTVMQSFREIDFPMNYTIAGDRLDSLVSALL
ncbi:MAG: type II restriction endonuclease [Promethearchaeati archaeon SRVP18_Atabeyarchaeia-1]